LVAVAAAYLASMSWQVQPATFNNPISLPSAASHQ
jgi:hypothetical protein